MITGHKKIFLAGRFNPSEILTGPEKFGKRLLEFLNNQNINVTFVDFFFKEPKGINLWNRLFGFRIVQKKPLVIKLGVFRIIFYLVKQKPDAIHIVNLENFQIVIFLLKKILRINLITTFHGLFDQELKISKYKRSILHKIKIKFLEKLAIRISDKLIFVSELLFEKFDIVYNIDRSKIMIINNCIDDEFFQLETNKKFYEPWKFVFYNSEFIDRGLDFIYNSLKKLKNYKLELHILGGADVIKEFSNGLKIYHYKYFPKETLINFLNDKHFVIKGNTFDSFSIFIAECMACGVIPIIHKEIGINELIKNGFNGFIYDTNSSESLKNLLMDIFERKYCLEEVSEKCKETVKNLRWKNIFENYLMVYEK